MVNNMLREADLPIGVRDYLSNAISVWAQEDLVPPPVENQYYFNPRDGNDYHCLHAKHCEFQTTIRGYIQTAHFFNQKGWQTWRMRRYSDPERDMAFMMSNHCRLGANSSVLQSLPGEPLRMIVDFVGKI